MKHWGGVHETDRLTDEADDERDNNQFQRFTEAITQLQPRERIIIDDLFLPAKPLSRGRRRDPPSFRRGRLYPQKPHPRKLRETLEKARLAVRNRDLLRQLGQR